MSSRYQYAPQITAFGSTDGYKPGSGAISPPDVLYTQPSEASKRYLTRDEAIWQLGLPEVERREAVARFGSLGHCERHRHLEAAVSHFALALLYIGNDQDRALAEATGRLLRILTERYPVPETLHSPADAPWLKGEDGQGIVA